MYSNKVILSVPPDLKYTSAVECFAGMVIPLLRIQGADKLIEELRSTLNEAFVNVIRHSPTSVEEFVEIIFEIDEPKLMIHFTDHGMGVSIKNKYPPYPGELVNTSQTLIRTIDGAVMARVESPFAIKLYFKEIDMDRSDPDSILKNAKPGGMGISLIVKLMDSVRFIYNEQEGNRLEITKYLENYR